MICNSKKYYIGTSGWAYAGWGKIFYPEKLASKDRLKYYSKFFNTAEVNYSFYHLPRPKTYEKWHDETPKNFVFALKLSRYITHIKKLKAVKSATNKFLKNAEHLKEKLGPILVQFPANFKADKKRLENFLKILVKDKKFAFEFRHKTWFCKNIYKLLNKYNATLCIADSARYPKSNINIRSPDDLYIPTTNFLYFRFHGPRELFASKYSLKELQKWVKIVKELARGKKEVYIYFNNDFGGYAVENAKQIRNLLIK